MDLHGTVDTTTRGAERMVVAHGRNVTRLWTFLAAGGMTDADPGDDDAVVGKAHGEGGAGTPRHDNASALSNFLSSSSSLSSAHSVFSQMSYGTTVVCAVDDAVDAAHTGSGTNTGGSFRRSRAAPVLAPLPVCAASTASSAAHTTVVP